MIDKLPRLTLVLHEVYDYMYADKFAKIYNFKKLECDNFDDTIESVSKLKNSNIYLTIPLNMMSTSRTHIVNSIGHIEEQRKFIRILSQLCMDKNNNIMLTYNFYKPLNYSSLNNTHVPSILLYSSNSVFGLKGDKIKVIKSRQMEHNITYNINDIVKLIRRNKIEKINIMNED